MIVRRLETVHRLRYFRFCNVLHIWTIRAIPTYRVYRLYDDVWKVNYCHTYMLFDCTFIATYIHLLALYTEFYHCDWFYGRYLMKSQKKQERK